MAVHAKRGMDRVLASQSKVHLRYQVEDIIRVQLHTSWKGLAAPYEELSSLSASSSMLQMS